MARGGFVNRDWIGPAAGGLVALAGLASRPGLAAALVVAVVAVCFWCTARGRWVLARPGRDDRVRRRNLRRVFGLQVCAVLAAWAALVLNDEFVAAAAVVAVGALLSALAWPWRWRLAEAAEDRERMYDASLAGQHLLAAGILAALTLGAVVALSGIAAALLAALVVSSVSDACAEFVRPRAADGGRAADSAPRAAAAPSLPAPMVRYRADAISTQSAVRIPPQVVSDQLATRRRTSGGARRADRRYTGRRVAARRR